MFSINILRVIGSPSFKSLTESSPKCHIFMTRVSSKQVIHILSNCWGSFIRALYYGAALKWKLEATIARICMVYYMITKTNKKEQVINSSNT